MMNTQKILDKFYEDIEDIMEGLTYKDAIKLTILSSELSKDVTQEAFLEGQNAIRPFLDELP